MVNSICIHVRSRGEDVGRKYNKEWISLSISKDNIPHFNAKLKLHSIGLSTSVSELSDYANINEVEINILGASVRLRTDVFLDAMERYGESRFTVALYQILDMYMGRIETYENLEVKFKFYTEGRIRNLPQIREWKSSFFEPLASDPLNSQYRTFGARAVFSQEVAGVTNVIDVEENGVIVTKEIDKNESIMFVRPIANAIGVSLNRYDYYARIEGVQTKIGALIDPMGSLTGQDYFDTTMYGTMLVRERNLSSTLTREVLRIVGLPSGSVESGIDRIVFTNGFTVQSLYAAIGISSSVYLANKARMDKVIGFSADAGTFAKTVAVSLCNLKFDKDRCRHVRFACFRDTGFVNDDLEFLRIHLFYEDDSVVEYVYSINRFSNGGVSDQELIFVEVDLHVFPSFTSGARGYLMSLSFSFHRTNQQAQPVSVSMAPVLMYSPEGELVVHGISVSDMILPDDLSIRLEVGK